MAFSASAQISTFAVYETVDGDTPKVYNLPKRNNTEQRFTASVLTIEQVKATVAFPKSDPVYESCMFLIDLYYTMALQKGMSEPEAAHVALIKFGELMLTFNK